MTAKQECKLFPGDQTSELSRQVIKLRSVNEEFNTVSQLFKNQSNLVKSTSEELADTLASNYIIPKDLSEQFINHIKGYFGFNKNELIPTINQLIKKEQELMTSIGSEVGIEPKYNKIYTPSQRVDILTAAREQEYELKEKVLFKQTTDYSHWGVMGNDVITLGQSPKNQDKIFFINGEPIFDYEFSAKNISSWDVFSHGFIKREERLRGDGPFDTFYELSPFIINYLSKDKKKITKTISIKSPENISKWKASPDGTIICEQEGNKIIKLDKEISNNPILLFKGKYDNFEPHPDGVLISREGKIILVTKQPNHKFLETVVGKYNKKINSDFHYHSDGIFVYEHDKNELLLNGSEHLTTNKLIKWRNWDVVPNGFITENKGTFTLHSFKRK